MQDKRASTSFPTRSRDFVVTAGFAQQVTAFQARTDIVIVKEQWFDVLADDSESQFLRLVYVNVSDLPLDTVKLLATQGTGVKKTAGELEMKKRSVAVPSKKS